MAPVDVLLVSLGSTAGLRAADAELHDALERAGARVELVAAARQRDIRTLALTDLAWARAARSAACAGIAAHAPHAVLYSTTTAALLWPRPGAIRFDALAAQTRPGRHGAWQRPRELRRLVEAPLLVPWSAQALDGAPDDVATTLVVPVPIEPSGLGEPWGARPLAAVTYAADPDKKGLDRVLEESVIEHHGKLYAWTIPLALPVAAELAKRLSPGRQAALEKAVGGALWNGQGPSQSSSE